MKKIIVVIAALVLVAGAAIFYISEKDSTPPVLFGVYSGQPTCTGCNNMTIFLTIKDNGHYVLKEVHPGNNAAIERQGLWRTFRDGSVILETGWEFHREGSRLHLIDLEEPQYALTLEKL